MKYNKMSVVFLALLLVVVVQAQIVSTPSVIDANPPKGIQFEKVVGFFTSTSTPGYFLGNDTGAYLYDSGLRYQIGSGSHYEHAIAFTYGVDKYAGVIASVNGQTVWYWNPKNWGGDPHGFWPVYVINAKAGCHGMRLIDVAGDGKLDVVCSAAFFNNTLSFIAYQNTYNSWEVHSNVTSIGEGVAVARINGSMNVIGCTNNVLLAYRYPGSRSAVWNSQAIGGCNAGASMDAIDVGGGRIIVMVASSETPTWDPGLVWYDSANGWASHQLDATHQFVHEVICSSLDGTPFCVTGEQEQASIICNSQGYDAHPTVSGCRVELFAWNGTSFNAPILLSNMGTHNQNLMSLGGAVYVVGLNHTRYGAYDTKVNLWTLTTGTPVGLQPDVYAITDSSLFTIHAGFLFYNGLNAVEEWQQVSGNVYQQWRFVASGSGFTICSV